MKVTRVWSMPNKHTFDIEPIQRLIDSKLFGFSIDPFANQSRLATVTNDIDPSYDTDYNLDALDFLHSFDDQSVDCVLFDPPYSPSQVSRSYRQFKNTVNMTAECNGFWSLLKQQIKRVVKPGGLVICCGWNSNGIGKKYGFCLLELLVVAHGGRHYDTLVTLEQKQTTLFDDQPSRADT